MSKNISCQVTLTPEQHKKVMDYGKSKNLSGNIRKLIDVSMTPTTFREDNELQKVLDKTVRQALRTAHEPLLKMAYRQLYHLYISVFFDCMMMLRLNKLGVEETFKMYKKAQSLSHKACQDKDFSFEKTLENYFANTIE